MPRDDRPAGGGGGGGVGGGGGGRLPPIDSQSLANKAIEIASAAHDAANVMKEHKHSNLDPRVERYEREHRAN